MNIQTLFNHYASQKELDTSSDLIDTLIRESYEQATPEQKLGMDTAFFILCGKTLFDIVKELKGDDL